jgi:4a-hydroxytetrahydrobiopterin dehydratase
MMCAIQGHCSTRLMLSGIATIGFLSLLPTVVPLDAIGRAPLDTHGSRALAEIMSPLLTDSEVSRQLAGLPNWRRTQGNEAAIAATFELTDFVAALDFVNQVGHEAELMNHHPDIDIRWNKVTLLLSTHSEGGLTRNDIELAHRINDVAGQEA